MPASRAACCACARPFAASHCVKRWKSTSRRFASAKSRTASLRGSRKASGQLRQWPSPFSASLRGLQRLEARVVFERTPAFVDECGEVLREGRIRASCWRKSRRARADIASVAFDGARPVDQRECFEFASSSFATPALSRSPRAPRARRARRPDRYARCSERAATTANTG